MQPINDVKQKLEQIEQKIEDLTDSEEYKDLAKKNFPRATQKPTEQEKGDWTLLKDKLSELKNDKSFWQNVILNSTASYVRKQDSTRKGYKKESASKSSRDLLLVKAVTKRIILVRLAASGENSSQKPQK